MTVQLLRVVDEVDDARDFEHFDRTFRPRLTRYLRRCYRGDSRIDVGEAVQETLARALASFDRLDPARDPWPWLVVVARNVIVDMTRRDRRATPVDETTLFAVEDSGPLPEDHVVRSEDCELLARALNAVPASQRTVLRLRFVEERSFTEIAAIVGRTENSVRQTLFRGRASLATQFAALGGHRYGVMPVGVVIAAWRAMRRGADRVAPATAALPAASTMLAASVAVWVGVVAGGSPSSAAPLTTPSLSSASVTSTVSEQPARRTPDGVRTAGSTASTSQADRVTATAGRDIARVKVAENPLATGRTHEASITVSTPVGHLTVKVYGENNDAQRPVCGAGPISCG